MWKSEAEKDLLTPEEVTHIETLLQYVVEDPDRVHTFARTVALGSYRGVQAGSVSAKIVAVFLCHFSDRPPMRLIAYGANSLVTEDKQVFHYRTPLDAFARIRSQVKSSELLPQVRLRVRCARNLLCLHAGLRGFEGSPAYPAASTWCDTVLKRHMRQGDTEKAAAKHVVCPSAYKGICHYAMNPDCEPDCPPDMVLLLEAKSGWNRHGGPELFTFDNHNPKGGCVLLNDGSVKFIRMAEELRALRWK